MEFEVDEMCTRLQQELDFTQKSLKNANLGVARNCPVFTARTLVDSARRYGGLQPAVSKRIGTAARSNS